jgi:hypothetical protein
MNGNRSEAGIAYLDNFVYVLFGRFGVTNCGDKYSCEGDTW